MFDATVLKGKRILITGGGTGLGKEMAVGFAGHQLGDCRLSANLLFVSASRQIPHPNRSPAKLRHHFRQASVSARGPVALRDFKQIQ